MSREIDFDIHFGEISERKANWRDVLPEIELDDDEELAVTPREVVGMLGFDPKEFSMERKGLSSIIKGGPGSGNFGHVGRLGKYDSKTVY